MTDIERIKELENRISFYEGNGVAKLFYSLNRKASEMADMLNRQSLTTLDLTDSKDKTFERLKIVWNDAASIAVAIDTLGRTAGVTNDELLDTNKAVYRRPTTPESIADSVGELAGQKM